ncbi:EscU/YscU/HrcU family type III secretion system export apparatus switch protein [Thermaurantiacus sp.]
MAEEPDKDEKSEAPTARRREDAKREGNLLTSRELGPALAGLVGALWLLLFGRMLGERLHTMMASALLLGPLDSGQSDPVMALLVLLAPLAWPLMALAAAMLLAAIAGRALVGGLVFATKLLVPKAERLNPLKGLGRIFGMQGLIELVKALAKGLLLLGVGGLLLWRDRDMLMNLSRVPLESAWGAVLDSATFLFLALTAGLALIAAGDLPVQFLRWLQKLRMTRKELKDDMRQTEGAPEVRAALRRMQHQVLKRANRAAVAEASVVLVNPAHFAVALRYRPGMDAAPVIVARGRGPVAAAIRDLAKDLDVPTLSYPEVARAIYFTGRVGQTIRADLYVVVATILAFVMRLADARQEEPPVVEVPAGYRYDADGRKRG